MMISKVKFGIMLWLVLAGLSFDCKRNSVDPVPPPPPTQKLNVNVYLTRPDYSALLQKQEDASEARSNLLPTITIDTTAIYQSMDGFGFALTGGSAFHINNMSSSKRQMLLEELFGHSETSIGISYLRISIGSSDLDAEVFSYDDLPAGETDVDMNKFSLDPDKKWLIPVLKQILAINPNIKILGSPWSAPVWMKEGGSSVGGSLKPEYFATYAKYFVKYIQGMAQEGIPIDAITVQNEPLYGGNNPSMLMPATDQASFIKNNLGPAFQAAGIKTKIIIYDHNADRPDYPLSILNDPEANKYIDGSAFHLYGGSISNLSSVHNAYPEKNLYFTEQWEQAPGNMSVDLKWSVEKLIIGATRNWCKAVLQWNLASNLTLTPHTPGGCSECLGAVTIEGDFVSRNPVYYVIAHASKFVLPGSVRIGSNSSSDLPNVAFKRPDGKKVIIVLNNTDGIRSFNISNGKKTLTSTLAAGAVSTFVWN